MNFDAVTESLARLSVLKFFPTDIAARLALVRLVGDFATSEAQVEWLVNRMLSLYNEWPGPKELRALFCSRYKPKDGIEAKSEKFLEGIPSEKQPEPLKALPPGSVTADPLLDNTVKLLAKSKDMNRALRTPRRIEASQPPQNPNYKPITQADIDAAVEANKLHRAQEEILP